MPSIEQVLRDQTEFFQLVDAATGETADIVERWTELVKQDEQSRRAIGASLAPAVAAAVRRYRVMAAVLARYERTLTER